MTVDTPSAVPPAPVNLPAPTGSQDLTAAPRSRAPTAALEYHINMRVVAWTLLLAVLSGPALYAWHQFQHERHAPALLDRARALFEQQSWTEAAAAVRLYLRMRPGDPEALILRAQTYDQLSLQNPELKELKKRTREYYDSAILANPDRRDLQLIRAQTNFKARRFSEALDDAFRLRPAPGGKTTRDTGTQAAHEPDVLEIDRLYAAAYRETSRLGKRFTPEEVLGVFEDMLQRHPGDVVLSVGLASLLDENSSKLPGAERAAAIVRADTVINEMVSRHPGDRQALIARYQFQDAHVDPLHRDRLLEKRQDTRHQDLGELLRTAPDDLEVLLIAASDYGERAIAETKLSSTVSNAVESRQLRAAAKEHTAIALGYAQRLAEVPLADQEAYFTFARLMVRMNQPEKAIDTVKRGLLRFGESDLRLNLRLNLRLLKLVLDAGDPQAANATLARIGPVFQRFAPTLRSHQRSRVDEALEMARARIQILDGKTEAALPQLQRLAASMTEFEDPRDTNDERVRRWRILAAACSQVGRHAESAEAYDALIRLEPYSVEHSLKAADEWCKAGAPKRAFQHLDSAPKVQFAWLSFAKTTLDRQLGTADATERDWQEFEGIVKQVQSRFPNDSAIIVLQATAALVCDDLPLALDLLKSLDSKAQVDWTFLPQVAALWQLTGNASAGKTALDHFRESGGDPVEFALAVSERISQMGETTVAITVLEQALEQSSLADRPVGSETDSGVIESARHRLQELRELKSPEPGSLTP